LFQGIGLAIIALGNIFLLLAFFGLLFVKDRFMSTSLGRFYTDFVHAIIEWVEKFDVYNLRETKRTSEF
jgi:hypothetical protein